MKKHMLILATIVHAYGAMDGMQAITRQDEETFKTLIASNDLPKIVVNKWHAPAITPPSFKAAICSTTNAQISVELTIQGDAFTVDAQNAYTSANPLDIDATCTIYACLIALTEKHSKLIIKNLIEKRRQFPAPLNKVLCYLNKEKERFFNYQKELIAFADRHTTMPLEVSTMTRNYAHVCDSLTALDSSEKPAVTEFIRDTASFFLSRTMCEQSTRFHNHCIMMYKKIILEAIRNKVGGSEPFDSIKTQYAKEIEQADAYK